MEEYFVIPSSEITTLLVENHVDLIVELRRQGVDVEGVQRSNPASGGSTRDLTLVILASGIGVVALSIAIRNIIEALARRPVVVKEISCLPAIDDKGCVIRDQNGKLLYQWIEMHKVINQNSPQRQEQIISATADLRNGLKIEISNKTEE